jgi:CubicO group peptidase (beta-lactamase class C family)
MFAYRRIAMVVAGALALVVGPTGAAEASHGTAAVSAEQRYLDELRARLAPEMNRLLDDVGRRMSLETLVRIGALDGLDRPAQTDPTDDTVVLAEELPPRRPGIGGVKGPGLRFDIDLFEENIRETLDEKTVGYAYSIGKDGLLYSEDGVGSARVNPDAPVTAQSATKTMTVASISKTVTAVALLHLFQDYGLSVDDPIGPWLPVAWARGDGVDDITFRELLTHKSGLLQNFQTATGSTGGKSTGTWDNIRIAIGQDIGSKTSKYANMNFSIFRIMLPKIAFGFDWSVLYDAPPLGVTPAQIDALTGAAFLGYVQWILAPAGVGIGCSSTDPNPTRLYAYPTNGAAGWGPESYINGCGGYGFYMSANGIASFMSHLRYTNVFLSPGWRAQMYDGELGIDEYAGDHGTYLGHGAVWSKGSGRGMRGCAMSFHIQVDVALLVNSRGDYPSACTVVTDAFDAAWV